MAVTGGSFLPLVLVLIRRPLWWTSIAPAYQILAKSCSARQSYCDSTNSASPLFCHCCIVWQMRMNVSVQASVVRLHVSTMSVAISANVHLALHLIAPLWPVLVCNLTNFCSLLVFVCVAIGLKFLLDSLCTLMKFAYFVREAIVVLNVVCLALQILDVISWLLR